ncbi:CatB-related O-acetyltransferase [Pseudomonas sp. UMC631]|nr:CatB-related O-acetyltransferase [Pseudomonas sp. UMA643]NTY18285.1 CatB-related O-acetyltransferase [Pseudomonas sp. UMC3103]NTY23371.1 CatB-related O-acetyltransferase [Pseudomonas sp. UMA603]NTY29808.1 CatB-related O-acetyltransferase [Pseudomonas sp. UMC3129]NTY52419.1 CatB-related O-acetyltransferase [Pseudomonas sp. UMC631]NTY65287.1 CatB-related O-acetyltransferase [Pseudomonas sp. UMC3106]NUA33344.1 CatB-related O-acetyltransferase [Pseudomonas sp. UMA601]
MDYHNIDSTIHPSATVYAGARIKMSTLAEYVSVGSFSRIDFSQLASQVRIDRSNHLFHASLGRHSYTGMNTVIMHANIASFCSISWNVSIGGAEHDHSRIVQHSFLYNDQDRLRPFTTEAPYDRFSKPLSIGHDVWIAAGAVVCRGVRIGNGAVVGANAVVTADVEPYAVVVGAPARVVKYRFPAAIIRKLEELQWWDWSADDIQRHFDLLSSAPDAEALEVLLNRNYQS